MEHFWENTVKLFATLNSRKAEPNDGHVWTYQLHGTESFLIILRSLSCSRNFPPLTEQRGSLPSSQQPVNGQHNTSIKIKSVHIFKFILYSICAQVCLVDFFPSASLTYPTAYVIEFKIWWPRRTNTLRIPTPLNLSSCKWLRRLSSDWNKTDYGFKVCRTTNGGP